MFLTKLDVKPHGYYIWGKGTIYIRVNLIPGKLNSGDVKDREE